MSFFDLKMPSLSLREMQMNLRWSRPYLTFQQQQHFFISISTINAFSTFTILAENAQALFS